MSRCTLEGLGALSIDCGVGGDARVGKIGWADPAANSAEESVETRWPPEASLLDTTGLPRLDAAALKMRPKTRPPRRAGAKDRLEDPSLTRSRSPPPPADPAPPAEPVPDASPLVELLHVIGVAELLAMAAMRGAGRQRP